jgi:DNA modification methylase
VGHLTRQRRQGWRLITADNLHFLKQVPSNSLDSMITDPPAAIGLMALAWDKNKGGRQQWIAWLSGILKECLRVLKPGAHALIWALPRTSHWTATAIEESGFEIRDVITHFFGTGFPKNVNIFRDLKSKGASGGLLERYAGFGTATKPACEFWILARKPLAGTIAENVMQWGAGGLNIDGCRISTEQDGRPLRLPINRGLSRNTYQVNSGSVAIRKTNLGRWPANLVFSHSEACGYVEKQATKALFGPQSPPERVWKCVEGCPVKELNEQAGNSSGEASRFFYCAKPAAKERDAGCGHLPGKTAGECTYRKEGSAGLESPRAGAGRTSGNKNYHPTLKPLKLMQYFCRLITPPGGTVLDPFTGSGTTGCAARLEGFRFVGIEKEHDYCAIARARIAHWNRQALSTESVPGAKDC